jgi:hypothetical protein
VLRLFKYSPRQSRRRSTVCADPAAGNMSRSPSVSFHVNFDLRCDRSARSVQSRAAMARGFAPPNAVVSRCLVGAVVLLIACAHAGLWALDRKEANAAAVQRPLASFSYTRLGAPRAGDPVSAAQIRYDLAVIAPHAGAVRTYSSTGGLETRPGTCRRARPKSHRRGVDRQGRGAQRPGDPVGDPHFQAKSQRPEYLGERVCTRLLPRNK